MFCTVGVLLRKLEGGLRGVSHVIVDEIHERDLNTDFVLIVLRDMVRAFPDLRIILMSATIDISMFAEYFKNPNIIEVEGRCFPVKAYFLEDFVEESGYHPSGERKRKNRKDKDKDEEDLIGGQDESQENLNAMVPNGYSNATIASMNQISERDLDYELVEKVIIFCEVFFNFF